LGALLSSVGSPSYRSLELPRRHPTPAPSPGAARTGQGGARRRPQEGGDPGLPPAAPGGNLGTSRARPPRTSPLPGAAVLPIPESRHICHAATSRSLGC
jgi:hypothetical protein